MPKWDYVCVNLVRSYGMNYRRNGIKMAEWKDRPIFEVMQMLGDEGFEFAAYDGQNYIFKKPVNPPQTQTGAVPTRPAASGQPAPTPAAPRPVQPVQGIQRPVPPGQAPNGQPRPTGPQPTGGLRSLRPPSQEDES